MACWGGQGAAIDAGAMAKGDGVLGVVEDTQGNGDVVGFEPTAPFGARFVQGTCSLCSALGPAGEWGRAVWLAGGVGRAPGGKVTAQVPSVAGDWDRPWRSSQLPETTPLSF